MGMYTFTVCISIESVGVGVARPGVAFVCVGVSVCVLLYVLYSLYVCVKVPHKNVIILLKGIILLINFSCFHFYVSVEIA